MVSASLLQDFQALSLRIVRFQDLSEATCREMLNFHVLEILSKRDGCSWMFFLYRAKKYMKLVLKINIYSKIRPNNPTPLQTPTKHQNLVECFQKWLAAAAKWYLTSPLAMMMLGKVSYKEQQKHNLSLSGAFKYIPCATTDENVP